MTDEERTYLFLILQRMLEDASCMAYSNSTEVHTYHSHSLGLLHSAVFTLYRKLHPNYSTSEQKHLMKALEKWLTYKDKLDSLLLAINDDIRTSETPLDGLHLYYSIVTLFNSL